MRGRFHFEVVPVDQVPGYLVGGGGVPPFVLVVDDERVIADTLVAILQSKDYEAIAAYSGEEALALAVALSPDLLLSDVMMPGMSGLDLACAVVDILPDCKAMLFSAHAPAAVLADPRYGRHAFPLLQKPLHPRDLLDRISHVTATC